MRALLIPALALYACGGAEPPNKTVPPAATSAPTASASSSTTASASSSAATAPSDAQDPHRVIRGSLMRSHFVAIHLRPFTKPCDADGGACPGVDELRAKRAEVAQRLDEAKAFALAHRDAIAARRRSA